MLTLCFLLQILTTKVDSHENDLKALTKAANNLHKLLDQYGSDDEDVERRKTDLNEKYRNTRAKLTERHAEIEEVTNKAKQFTDVIKQTHKWVTGVVEKTEPMYKKGIPKDVKKIEELIHITEVS